MAFKSIVTIVMYLYFENKSANILLHNVFFFFFCIGTMYVCILKVLGIYLLLEKIGQYTNIFIKSTLFSLFRHGRSADIFKLLYVISRAQDFGRKHSLGIVWLYSHQAVCQRPFAMTSN